MMTFNQLQLILEKIKQADNNDNKAVRTQLYGNRVSQITAEFNRGVVDLSCGSRGITFSFRCKGITTRGVLQYALRYAWLSPSWYIWRSHCRKYENQNKQLKKEEEQRAIEFERQQFNTALLETFPELLEDELLGDD